MGTAYAVLEYFLRQFTTDPQAFWPLMARSLVTAVLIALSVSLFDMLFQKRFVQKPFLYLVLVRTFFYTLVISLWLGVVNGFWQIIASNKSFMEGFRDYLLEPTYIINLTTIFLIILFIMAILQVNGLHRKGELWNFIIGKYHRPQEVDRIFSFIDMKDSTGIAENLGHYDFGLFLKDYYTDLTFAIQTTKAEIYQYVGDEIILSWPPEIGFKNNNAVKCIQLIRQTLFQKKHYYQTKYGYFPMFRAGIHSGRVLVTWVGEIKKEIVYVGDVLNTTSRIQEECKRMQCDLLVSGEIASRVEAGDGYQFKFEEETVPRGKETPIKLYSLKII